MDIIRIALIGLFILVSVSFFTFAFFLFIDNYFKKHPFGEPELQKKTTDKNGPNPNVNPGLKSPFKISS